MSEKIPMKKLWYHMIKVKKGFVSKKGKMYLLLREKREEMQKYK